MNLFLLARFLYRTYCKILDKKSVLFWFHSNPSKTPPEHLLKAVMRIGALAKGLLLHGDLNVELVLMCKEKPTKGMLNRVADNLPQYLQVSDSVFNLLGKNRHDLP